MNLKAQMAALKAAMQETVDKAKAESRDLTAEESADIEAKAGEYAELKGRLEQSEKAQALVTELAAPVEGDGGPEDARTERKSAGGIGRAFVESDGFKAFRKAHPSGVGGGTPVRIEAKGLGGINEILGKATLDTTTGQVPAQRQPGYRNEIIDDPLSLLDLITTGTTDASVIEYARVVSETDGAAIVAEGALKPLSDITTELADAKAHTYADGFDATNQMLADDGALATFMEGRVRRHIRSEIERVLLEGAGTATEPAGILNTTGVQSQAFDTDVVSTIAAALEKVAAVNADPQAVVLNPADFWALRLLRENGTSGAYLSGGPFNAGGTPNIWGVPIVQSRRVTAGTALVGNFRSVNFLEREPLSVLAFNQHKDYAQRNLTYVRAELRAAQVIWRPNRLVVAEVGSGASS